jgi:hypothetical protein
MGKSETRLYLENAEHLLDLISQSPALTPTTKIATHRRCSELLSCRLIFVSERCLRGELPKWSESQLLDAQR